MCFPQLLCKVVFFSKQYFRCFPLVYLAYYTFSVMSIMSMNSVCQSFRFRYNFSRVRFMGQFCRVLYIKSDGVFSSNSVAKHQLENDTMQRSLSLDQTDATVFALQKCIFLVKLRMAGKIAQNDGLAKTILVIFKISHYLVESKLIIDIVNQYHRT